MKRIAPLFLLTVISGATTTRAAVRAASVAHGFAAPVGITLIAPLATASAASPFSSALPEANLQPVAEAAIPHESAGKAAAASAETILAVENPAKIEPQLAALATRLQNTPDSGALLETLYHGADPKPEGSAAPSANAPEAKPRNPAPSTPPDPPKKKFNFNDATPFGGYTVHYMDGQKVHYYKWSMSPRTLFQSLVLGPVAGPLIWLLNGRHESLLWCVLAMALAPLLVDLLKPTLIYFRR